MIKIFFLFCIIFAICLSGCTQHHALKVPLNPSNQFYGTDKESGTHVKHEQFASTDLEAKRCFKESDHYKALHYRVDKVISTQSNVASYEHTNDTIFNGQIPLSIGDMVALFIENGEGFNGNYVVDQNGYLRIPFIEPIFVAGLPVRNVTEKIEFLLTRAQMFKPSLSQVRLSLLQWSDIEILVSGAVFEPGRVRINESSPKQIIDERLMASGDYNSKRMLSEAIRAASGVRPDAKVDQVIVIRNGWQIQVDLSGIFTGDHVQDIALISGDKVIVPTTGCFQSALVRPTQITPKGLRIFMSNLIDPAFDNAAGAVGRFSSSMPYGVRLLQAAVSANCVGGKQWTNASRKVVLASKNPLTNQIQVAERSIELLMRQAHLDLVNPYMMPNDAIACYDSDVSNLRDVAKGLVEIMSPLKLL